MTDIDPQALEVARIAVEDALIDFRDNHRFMVGANGFVVRNADGSESSIMRMSTIFGLSIGIKAYLGLTSERDLVRAELASARQELDAVRTARDNLDRQLALAHREVLELDAQIKLCPRCGVQLAAEVAAEMGEATE